MNEVTRSLEEITGEAVTIYNRMKKDYRRFGELMIEAKKLLPHGQWLPYLRKNFPMIGDRQANRYMELARDTTGILQLESTQSRSKIPLFTVKDRNTKSDSESDLPSVETTKLPPAPKALDEIGGRIARYIQGSQDMTKLEELVVYPEQYSDLLWNTAKDAIRRSINKLQSILERMENARR